MPRAKHPTEMILRQIRVPAKEWAEFQRRGGARWLREFLQKPNKFPDRDVRKSEKPITKQVTTQAIPRSKLMGANSIFNLGSTL